MKCSRTHHHLQSPAITGNLGYLAMNSVDKSLISLLQKTISLVQDKEPALLETQLASLYEILQSARCGHNNVNTGLQG